MRTRNLQGPLRKIVSRLSGGREDGRSGDWAWDLRAAGGSILSRQLTFEADGIIAGSTDPQFHRWTRTSDSLIVLDDVGSETFAFRIERDDLRDHAILRGHAISGVAHRFYLVRSLRQSQLPQRKVDINLPRLRRRRQNLVVVRANQSSLHTRWTADLPDRARNWDLCLSWYGDEASYQRKPTSEYAVLQNKGRKFTSLYDLCYTGSEIFKYRYVTFFDDDIMTSWNDLNTMFDTALRYDLKLCQPSLTSASHISHQITEQVPGNILRYTNYVEVMCPVFSRRALELCAGTFKLSESAWGLDYVWSKIIGPDKRAIAVIDSVAVEHTRPLGQGYDLEAANTEMNNIIELYGLNFSFAEYGTIAAE